MFQMKLSTIVCECNLNIVIDLNMTFEIVSTYGYVFFETKAIKKEHFLKLIEW